MKVVILHPPMYPINHRFFNLLGEKLDLIVYHFGEYPILHQNWSVNTFKKEATNYQIKVFGRGPITFKITANPKFLVELKKDKPSYVISIAFGLPSLYASVCKKLLHYKFLISTDAIPFTDDNLSLSRKVMRKLIAKNSNAFIAASSLTEEYLRSLNSSILIKQSLQTIDIRDWTRSLNSLASSKHLREELNLPKDKTILLGVGNFIKGKNWETIFHQINSLKNTIFVLVGNGEEKENYLKLIQKLAVEEQVFIISRREGIELQKYFKASDIFILPSFSDRFGYVVVEALASSLPVICSENCGAASLINNNTNGYIINPNKTFIDEISLISNDLEMFKLNSYSSIKSFFLEDKVSEWIELLTELDD